MKNLKITIVLIGYCITSMMYASQAQQKTKGAAAAASSSSSSAASASASGSSSKQKKDWMSSWSNAEVIKSRMRDLEKKPGFHNYAAYKNLEEMLTRRTLFLSAICKYTTPEDVKKFLDKGGDPNYFQIEPDCFYVGDLVGQAIDRYNEPVAQALIAGGACPFQRAIDGTMKSFILCPTKFSSGFRSFIEKAEKNYQQTLKQAAVEKSNSSSPSSL